MLPSGKRRTSSSKKFRKMVHKKVHRTYRGLALLLLIIYILSFEYLMLLENQPEHANPITAIYWATTTIATVGYGDVVFNSLTGQLFSILVQVVGIILISGFLVTYIIMPRLDRVLMVRLPRKVPSSMKDHIIISGYNQLVETLIDELAEQEILFVIIDDDAELIKELEYKDTPCVYGAPSDRQTLINANIEKARVLITNMSDERNANIALTAKEFENVKIIAIVEDMANSKYLKYAGADTVVSPKSMFGQHIGKKAVDRLVSRVTGATEVFEGIHITEFPIYLKSPLLGKTLKEISGQSLTGARIVGIWKSGTLSFNPKEEDVIKDNSVLLAVGTPEQLSRLKKLTH